MCCPQLYVMYFELCLLWMSRDCYMLQYGHSDSPLHACYVCTRSSKGLPVPGSSSACFDILLITRGEESNVVTANQQACIYPS